MIEVETFSCSSNNPIFSNCKERGRPWRKQVQDEMKKSGLVKESTFLHFILYLWSRMHEIEQNGEANDHTKSGQLRRRGKIRIKTEMMIIG